MQTEPLRRPVLITLFCLFVIFVHGVDLLRALDIDRIAYLRSYLPLWYMLLTFVVMYPIELFGVLEIWRMKRRGLNLFGSVQILWVLIWLSYFGMAPKVGQIIVIAVFIYIVLAYRNDMQPHPASNP